MNASDSSLTLLDLLTFALLSLVHFMSATKHRHTKPQRETARFSVHLYRNIHISYIKCKYSVKNNTPISQSLISTRLSEIFQVLCSKLVNIVFVRNVERFSHFSFFIKNSVMVTSI